MYLIRLCVYHIIQQNWIEGIFHRIDSQIDFIVGVSGLLFFEFDNKID